MMVCYLHFNKGLTIIEVELDAKVVVDLVNSRLDTNRSLLNRFHQIRVNHIYREANKYADVLAKKRWAR